MTAPYTTITRAVSVERCPCCETVAERLYTVPGFDARCWGCLLALMAALDEAMREAEIEASYDRYHEGRGGY